LVTAFLFGTNLLFRLKPVGHFIALDSFAAQKYCVCTLPNALWSFFIYEPPQKSKVCAHFIPLAIRDGPEKSENAAL
jgi:hypothetical protein